jgi:flagellar biosynthesis/type III secretory pathway chaperone
MNESLERLVTALREELQQYGEMLALLDTQQQLIASRSTEELLNNVAAVNAQTSVIQLARRTRGERQQDVARELGLKDVATFTDLAQALPEPHGVLVRALVGDNNQCLHRVRQRVAQNHLLLTRSVDLIQRLIATLLAVTQRTVYQADGTVAPAPVAERRLCDAIG